MPEVQTTVRNPSATASGVGVSVVIAWAWNVYWVNMRKMPDMAMPAEVGVALGAFLTDIFRTYIMPPRAQEVIVQPPERPAAPAKS